VPYDSAPLVKKRCYGWLEGAIVGNVLTMQNASSISSLWFFPQNQYILKKQFLKRKATQLIKKQSLLIKKIALVNSACWVALAF